MAKYNIDEIISGLNDHEFDRLVERQKIKRLQIENKHEDYCDDNYNYASNRIDINKYDYYLFDWF